MRPIYAAALLVLCSAAVFGQAPTNYYSDSFSSIDSNSWQQNGSVSGGSSGLSGSGGSLISRLTAPTGIYYEVQMGARADKFGWELSKLLARLERCHDVHGVGVHRGTCKPHFFGRHLYRGQSH